jgi:hypothetical protein
MRIIAGLLLFTAVSIFGQSTNTNFVTGQWDFDSGDLRATVGSALEFRGNTSGAASFVESVIAGQRARVLRLEELTPEQGLIMPHGASPNNGGTNVNQYTLILDVMWPSESDRTWRAILQSDTNNVRDPILFVSSGNRLGINNTYNTVEILPNTWYRVAAVFDLSQTNSILRKYVNGMEATQQLLDNSRDREFSLLPTALLFTGAPGDSAPVFINSIQFRSVALSAEDIQELGLPGAGGISGGGGLPLEDVRIQSIRRDGSDVVIEVSGGGNLQLQRTSSLRTPSWQNVGAPNSSGSFRVPMTEPVSFFRVQRL